MLKASGIFSAHEGNPFPQGVFLYDLEMISCQGMFYLPALFCQDAGGDEDAVSSQEFSYMV